MRNYLIWECGDDNNKMIQVFNNCDLPSVQKQFIEQGYFIKETFLGSDHDYFFIISRLEER